MRSSRIAIIVIVLLLLIAGSAYALFLSQNTSLAIPISPGQPGSEQSTQCPSNQYAYNESSSGSFICSQVVFTQLSKVPFPFFNDSSVVCTLNTASVYNMTGFNIEFPANSSKVFVELQFALYTGQSNTLSEYILTYGTGTPPSCGHSPVGTTIGNYQRWGTVSSNQQEYFAPTINGVLSGLTIGSTYWIDLTVYSGSSATWEYYNSQLSIIYV